MKINKCFLFAIVIILLTSCTNTGSRLDDGLLTDNPCKVPCWNGLIPGRSTFEDVDQFVKGLNTKEWTDNNTFIDQPECLEIQVKDKPGPIVRAFVNFHLYQEKLTYIQSSHHSMPKLKQIVGHLGPPEYVEALDVIGPDGSFYSLNIYYPKRGVAFKVDASEKDLGFIKPEMAVSTIEYFEPGELLNYFLAKYACNVGRDGAEKNGQNEIAKYIQTWSGFGAVNIINAQ